MPSTPTAIVHFAAHSAAAPSLDYPRADRVLRGNPQRSTWPHYENDVVSCGVWACEVGAWKIQFAPHKEEFFCVIEGRVCLRDAAGFGVEVAAGEAAVIPPGFVGTFEVLAPVRKYYVVIDRSRMAEQLPVECK